MIDVKELRIGNWYLVKNPLGGYMGVDQFNNWTEALTFEGYGEGIPLISEILLQCGFNVLEKFYTKDINDDWYILFIEQNVYLKIEKHFPHEPCYVSEVLLLGHCKFLHQLQNLYFALTRTELTYNHESATESPTPIEIN